MIKDKRIELIFGDITAVEADAIINAANERLLGGGGVDGAIHKAAGPALLEECRKTGGCPTGKARLTGGYNLKAKHIIHTVGPVWRGGHRDEHMLLASCYQESLGIAAAEKYNTVAFPAISTGAYGFPYEQAALIALTETSRFLKKNRYPDKVIFVLFDKRTYKTYQNILGDEKTSDGDR